MPRVFRASVVQCATPAYDLAQTLAKLHRFAKEANAAGSELVVFPEAFVGGYPKGMTFGATVGNRSPEGREEYLAYHKAAIEVPGPATERIEEIAKEFGIVICAGVIERDVGTLYCTCIFVTPDGGLEVKRRKLMPTGAERLIWGFGGAEDVKGKILETTFLKSKLSAKLSGTICWENYMPLLRTHWYSLGTQIYCVPTVDARESFGVTMQHIATEGRVFVLSACQFAQQKDYPPSATSSQDPEEILIAGGSIIVSPLGVVLAGPLRKTEGVLTADLDLDDIARGKFDLDVVGHYARDDIFKLVVAGQ